MDVLKNPAMSQFRMGRKMGISHFPTADLSGPALCLGIQGAPGQADLSRLGADPRF